MSTAVLNGSPADPGNPIPLAESSLQQTLAGVSELADRGLLDRRSVDAVQAALDQLIWTITSAAPGATSDQPGIGKSYSTDFDPNWLLREFLEKYLYPRACPNKAYMKELRTTVGYWEQLTGNPPLSRARSFISGAAQRIKSLPLAQNTCRKHAIQLQVILRWLGPPDDECPGRAGYLNTLPKLPKARRELNYSIKHYTLEQLAAYLKACRSVPPPRRRRSVPEPLAYQCMAVLAYNTALRIKSLLRLRYDWFEKDELGWWAVMPSHSMKKAQGRRIYFNRHAMHCVNLLREYTRGEGKVLGLPVTYSWVERIRKNFIVPAAGLPKVKRFGFHGMRQACSFQVNRINPAAAQLILGHATRNVTLEFYTDWGLVAETLEQLPQPDWTPYGPADYPLGAKPPKLRRNGKGQAFLRLRGRRIHFGRWGTPESQARYEQFVTEFKAGTVNSSAEIEAASAPDPVSAAARDCQP